MMATTQKITTKSVIGDVIQMHPAAKEIIKKYFGTGCFTCPGINVEDIGFGSAMHNLDPQKIVDELNEAIEKETA
jgi:hypothetical protein